MERLLNPSLGSHILRYQKPSKIMRLIIIKIKTVIALGISNIGLVLIYRLGLKSSLHPACRLKSDVPRGPFFSHSKLPISHLKPINSWKESGTLFGILDITVEGHPPDWLQNPLTKISCDFPLEHWWLISDFDSGFGDIKVVWELSRMDWAIAFAQRARNGDRESLTKLNSWISDWSSKNPPFRGPNWKCGQEASIRIINLACCLKILGQQKIVLPGMKSLIETHLKRISSTISYGIAQNNNHGTSEAAALYIGGSILVASGCSSGLKWQMLGLYWLENRINNLIEIDGSFSQHSLNYHRMALDTLCFVELWRRDFGLDSFSRNAYERLSLATNWLYQMVSKDSGDGPNIGANDGARLLPLTDSGYRDYRPSVQLAMALFEGRRAYLESGDWDNHLAWLGISPSNTEPPPYVNCDFDAGGYKIVRCGEVSAVLRVPVFRYRPSQADALHLDLWNKGENMLRDAGSYSYNSVPDLSWYFNGTVGHNTVQFDDRDQMPKLSRFLFGDWLKPNTITSILSDRSEYICAAGYIDAKNAKHIRKICLSKERLIVEDLISGFEKKAVMRWRLLDSEWTLDSRNGRVVVSNGGHLLTVVSDIPIISAKLTEGWSSLFYMQKQRAPVLEIEVNTSGSLITEFQWSQ